MRACECGHHEEEHEPQMGVCVVCGCERFRSVVESFRELRRAARALPRTIVIGPYPREFNR